MAFGFPNPFGGSSSSDKDKNQSSSSHDSNFSNDTTNSVFPSSNQQSQSYPLTPSATSASSASSQDIKSRLQTAIATQSNVANAKALISRINETCFDHCVPAPGGSLSAKEQGCLSACMEKYIDGWNVVSRTYVARLQREGASVNAAAGGGGAQGSQGSFF